MPLKHAWPDENHGFSKESLRVIPVVDEHQGKAWVLLERVKRFSHEKGASQSALALLHHDQQGDRSDP